VNDLQILSSRGGNSLVRSVRTGAALFGSGIVVGVVVGLIFHALFFAVLDAIVVVAAVVILLGIALRLVVGRKRRL
jgi:hypothetical protein